MESTEILDTLRDAADAVVVALSTFEGSGLSGERQTQYHLDIVADVAACGILLGRGLAVFSEESGAQGSGDVTVVIDPVDGSTNTDRGIPFSCISLCALDGQGPLVSLVRSLTTGVTYEAIRGTGARRDGVTIHASDQVDPAQAIVGVNGILPGHQGWAQVRTMGAAALEICLVAEGALDAYLQAGGASIHPWDYLAGLHIAEEAGAHVLSIDDEPLTVIEAVPRRPLVAGTKALALALADTLRTHPHRPCPTVGDSGA